MNVPALPTYDIRQTYDWNYRRPPSLVEWMEGSGKVPERREVPGNWTFAGLPVASPLGIAAGPLLNGAWCRYYAQLGFDVLTYKTVRSRQRECYPLPNLTPVECSQLAGDEPGVSASTESASSWAVSFGMPSQSPSIWQEDVQATKEAFRELGREPQPLLSVSVVATVDPGAAEADLVNDYAQCARLAVAAGADCVEANFSCPNVSTCDGDLYLQPALAGRVAAALREATGDVPLLVKVGHFRDDRLEDAVELLRQLAPLVTAVVTTNSVASRVCGANGEWMFSGQRRGICGEATRNASLRQVEFFRRWVDRTGAALRIIGVGGISTASHVRSYLDAGAEAVQLATAAMQQPDIGLRIRDQW